MKELRNSDSLMLETMSNRMDQKTVGAYEWGVSCKTSSCVGSGGQKEWSYDVGYLELQDTNAILGSNGGRSRMM